MKHLLYIFFAVILTSPAFSQSKFEQGLKSMAEENWQEAITLFTMDSDSSHSVESEYNIGLCYIGLEDFNSALYFFEKALTSSPANEQIIINANLSFKKLQPEGAWTHPYNGLKRMILSLSINSWIFLSLLLTVLLSWVIYLLVLKEKSSNNRNSIILVISIPIWFFTLFGVYVAHNHASELHYLLPKNANVSSFLTVDGIESEEKLQIGKRYEVITGTQSEWVRFKGGTNKSLWIRKSDVNIY